MEKKQQQFDGVRVQSGEDLSSVRASYSKDGKWLFVCCGHTVKVYNTTSHELVHSLNGHKEVVTSCSLNPSNALQLLTASLDGKVIIWDYIDGSLLREMAFGVPISYFALRPGKKEPQMFFQIEKGAMEVDTSEEVEATFSGADNVVVGVSSDAVLERNPAVSPSNQLAQATEYLDVGAKSSEICFSFDGEFVMTFVRKSLVVCNIAKRRQRSFVTSYELGAIACHPSELCVATGNQRGQIELWWGWNHRKKDPVTTLLHWHAHAVSDLCFTSDGTYLLSGGEECVLVLWQLSSCKSHYRPRLGAQITRIACDPTDQSFAISLQNNIIQVVSGLDNNVEWSVGGMRRAHTQNPKENGMKTGLQWDPRSMTLVTNSNPGFLQWYKPEVDLVTSQLDVTGLNYVSRMNDPFVLVTVEHAAFSSDGRWLATVEWRDDGKTTPELRLKFWQFVSSRQEFELNTCIDPPHTEKITSLVFQPPPPLKGNRKTESLSAVQSPVPLSVSTSEDGKFKSWVLVDSEGERERPASWACRSAGYYHSLPCRGACFSGDGSLLAVNFKKFLTLWDPFTCELRRAFSCPFTAETFAQHIFGSSTSSHYLISSTDHHLIVWDLLSCSVLWSVATDVDVLVSDPTSPIAAAFVPSKEGTTHLYRFNPSSPTPVSVGKSVCSGSVTSAVYVPPPGTATHEWCEGRQEMAPSTLFFQTSSQILYRVYNEGEDSNTDMTVNGVTVGEREEQSRRAYFEVFGEAKKGEMEVQNIPERVHPVRHKDRLKILDAAPHVLPPLSSLASTFLHSLLPPHREGEHMRDEVEDDVDSDEGEEMTGVRSDSDEDSETAPPGGPTPHSKETVGSTTAPMAMDTDDVTLPGLRVANYDWLTEMMKSN